MIQIVGGSPNETTVGTVTTVGTSKRRVLYSFGYRKKLQALQTALKCPQANNDTATSADVFPFKFTTRLPTFEWIIMPLYGLSIKRRRSVKSLHFVEKLRKQTHT